MSAGSSLSQYGRLLRHKCSVVVVIGVSEKIVMRL